MGRRGRDWGGHSLWGEILKIQCPIILFDARPEIEQFVRKILKNQCPTILLTIQVNYKTRSL